MLPDVTTMKVQVRVGQISASQVSWLNSQNWNISSSVRQGLRLAESLGLAPDPDQHYPIRRLDLTLSPSDIEAIRATGLSVSEAVRRAIATAYQFHIKVHAMKEVVAA